MSTSPVTASHPALAPSGPYAFYRRSLLTPEQVRELSELRPARAVRDVAVGWLCIVAAWVAVANWTYWWVAALAIPVVGSRFYALFIIAHDGFHRRIFPNRAHNDLFNDLCILGAIGAITRINNRNHLQHHQHLATNLDPDRHKHACFNKAEVSQVLAFASGLSSVFRSLANVFLHRSAPRRGTVGITEFDGQLHYTVRDLAIVLGWQATLIIGLTMAIGWWAYPVLWLLPVYVFAFLADNLRSFVEHSHPEADEKADAHRLITFLSNPVERLFIAPMNMNYHAAHHLWVSIPYYNLPRADEAIRQMPAARTLEWRGSYMAYLWRYCRALPLEECKGPSQPQVSAT
jgi:fatty acid desaturase